MGADVEPSIERLNLKEDDDYKKIVDEWKEKSQAFLQAKAKEGSGDHAAAEAARARQRIALQQKQLEERKAARAQLNAERVEKSKQLNIGKPNTGKKDEEPKEEKKEERKLSIEKKPPTTEENKEETKQDVKKTAPGSKSGKRNRKGKAN